MNWVAAWLLIVWGSSNGNPTYVVPDLPSQEECERVYALTAKAGSYYQQHECIEYKTKIK